MKIRYLALISLMAGAPAGALDLKGIELGKVATPAQLKAAFDVDCPAHDGYCENLTQIAGVWVKVSVLTDEAGRVASIRGNFDSGFYAQLKKAALEKYGKPAGKRTTPLQNGLGAHFTTEDIGWIDAEGARVWIVQFINATEGLLLLESAATRAADEAKEHADKLKSHM